MKRDHRRSERRNKHMTLGDFIVNVYDIYDRKRAKAVVQLACDANLIMLRQPDDARNGSRQPAGRRMIANGKRPTMANR